MLHYDKAPLHRVSLTLADELFPGRADRMGTPGVMAPVKYEEMPARLGQVRLWETDYYQRLTAEPDSHPVRRFTESTYARPILATLDP
jgi:trans-aconitate 2-methyltransferase